VLHKKPSLLGAASGVVAGIVDPLRLADVRAKLPALQHRTLVGT